MASAQQEDRHFEIDHLATSVLFVAPTCCKDGSVGYAALRSGAVEAPPVLRRQALGHVMSRVDALTRRENSCEEKGVALPLCKRSTSRLLDYVVFDVFVRKFRNCNLVQYERHGITLCIFRIATLMHSSCVVELPSVTTDHDGECMEFFIRTCS